MTGCIQDLDQLHALYGQPGAEALRKVAPQLTPQYRAWIEKSRFCILSTVGPEGTDATPRGDTGPVVAILDAGTLALPDWHGNNRIDNLRNIVRDPRASLMFFVPGAKNVIRVNGTARISAARDLVGGFERNGKLPRSVIVFTIAECYSQCGRAILRADLWTGADHSAGLPTVGDILASMTGDQVGGAEYDKDWNSRAERSLW